jgi:hypothetical protein
VRYTLLAALVAVAGSARAEPVCEMGPAEDPFATCFDPGTRFHLGASALVSEGVGEPAVVGSTGLAVRHVVSTDDPAVWWRLEHVVLDSQLGREVLDATAYRGRFIRHSRDGRIVLPTSPPRKIFLPFDLGAEVEVGAVRTLDRGDNVELGVVRTALFLEILRSPSFGKRLAIGGVARWDLSAVRAGDDHDLVEHRVAPFTLAMAAARVESASGLTLFDLSLEGGRIWSSETGWRSALSGRATFERVLIALDDHPLSLFAQAGYADPGQGLFAISGLRFGWWSPPGPPL